MDLLTTFFSGAKGHRFKSYRVYLDKSLGMMGLRIVGRFVTRQEFFVHASIYCDLA